MKTKYVKVEIPPKGWDEYYDSLSLDEKACYSKESLMIGKAICDAIAEWETMIRDEEKGGSL